MQKQKLLPAWSTSTAPDFSFSIILQQNILDAIHHLCLITKNKFPLSIHGIIERVEKTLNSVTQQGYIRDLSDLTRFIDEGDFTQV